jgi:ferredoxin
MMQFPDNPGNQTGKTDPEETIRVMVDQTKCESIGECVRIAPDVFRFEAGSKKAAVALERVPMSLCSLVCAAAKACPVGAISVTDAKGTAIE